MILSNERRMIDEQKSDVDSAELDDLRAIGEVMTPLAKRYYDIAVRHHAAAAAGDLTYAGDHAAVSIFFAVAALEAYLPELSFVPPDPTKTGRFLDLPCYRMALEIRSRPTKNEIERQYASAAPATVAARAPWYTACQCLRRLRNALTHYDSEFRAPGAWPEKLARSRCEKVIRGLGAGEAWASQALAPGVAAWACETVRATIEWFHSQVGGAAPWDVEVALGGWSRLPGS